MKNSKFKVQNCTKVRGFVGNKVFRQFDASPMAY